MNKEIWKDIKGYEGLYQVSSKGNVRSLDRMVNSPNGMRMSKGRILKQCKCGSYSKVTLSKSSRVKSYDVHPLVAKAFIPNPNNYPQINHKNENRYDNRVENLEWCTPKYNANYGTRNKRAAEKHRIPCKLEIKQKLGHPVVAYKDNIFVGEYYSIKECSRVLGLDNHSVHYVLQGKYSQTKGYIIKYK